MGQAIEQRRRQLFIPGKHGDPFGKREVRRHHGRPAFVAIGDQIEEELPTGALEGDEPDLVDLCGAPHKSTNATPAVMWS